VIDAILGVSLLVGVPLLLYHALRLGAAVMITMRPRHRVIAELALGGVLIGTGLDLGFGSVLPSAAAYFASPLLCSVGACFAAFAVHEMVKSAFSEKDDRREEDTPNLGSANSYDLASHELLREHLKDARQYQVWGESVRGAVYSDYYHTRLLDSGIRLPEDCNLILIKHDHGVTGSIQQRFLYLDRFADKWIFSHAGTRGGKGKFVYLTEEAFHLLTHNVNMYPKRRAFLERLLEQEYSHASAKLEGRWKSDPHRYTDPTLSRYVIDKFMLNQMRLAEPAARSISETWHITSSIIEYFIDSSLRGLASARTEAKLRKEAQEARDLARICRVILERPAGSFGGQETVLREIKTLVRFNIAQTRSKINFMEQLKEELPEDVVRSDEFEDLLGFMRKNLDQARRFLGVIDDERGLYENVDLESLAGEAMSMLKSMKAFENTEIVFNSGGAEERVIADGYRLRWEFLAAVLEQFDTLPSGKGRIEVSCLPDPSKDGVSFTADNPLRRAEWAEGIKRKCTELNGAFYHHIRKEYRRDLGSCFAGCYVLSRVLAEETGLPLGGDSPDRIEIEVGEGPQLDLLKGIAAEVPSTHAWIALWRKGKRALLIDPARGQYDAIHSGNIFVGDYADSLEKMRLKPPDEIQDKGAYRSIEDILTGSAEKEKLREMAGHVLEDAALIRKIESRLDIRGNQTDFGISGWELLVSRRNLRRIIEKTAFSVGEIKREAERGYRKEVYAECEDEASGQAFSFVLDIYYVAGQIELIVKIPVRDLARVYCFKKPEGEDMLFLCKTKVSLKEERSGESTGGGKHGEISERGGPVLSDPDLADEAVSATLRALDVQPKASDWRTEDGVSIYTLPAHELAEREARVVYDLSGEEEFRGRVSLVRYKGIYAGLVWTDQQGRSKILDLAAYREDLSGETHGQIDHLLREKFPGSEKMRKCTYSYAVFNNWGGLIEICPVIPSSDKYLVPVRIERIALLPGVYNGVHPSSEISARATGNFAEKGKKVLVVGCGKGLEARIAASKGARVDAVDMLELAVEDTKLTCRNAGYQQVHAFKNHLLTGLGEYDLIIFNMPHVSGPLWDKSPSPYEHSNVTDFGGALLKEIINTLPGHLAPKGKAVLVNSEFSRVEDLVAQREDLSVTSDFFGVPGSSKAFIITREPKGQGAIGMLRFPAPYGHVQGIEEKLSRLIDKFCRAHEDDASTVIPEKEINWPAVNAYLRQRELPVCAREDRPLVHVLDVASAEGRGLFGFPLEPGCEQFAELLPVVSYIAEKDGKLHIFMTSAFYEDYLELAHVRETQSKRALRVIRLAEILDHEIYENSAEVLAYPEQKRHHLAALHARHFIPRGQKLSAYHKWALDNLALTENGREHIMLMLDEERPEPAQERQKQYEKDFYQYAKSVLPREKYPDDVQRLAHHLLRVYRHGDVDAFRQLCDNAGVDHERLNKRIEEEEKKHVMNAVEGFSADTVITETSETDVEIDRSKYIVRKLLKNKYAEFIWDVFMKTEHGPACMDLFITLYTEHGEDILYDEKLTPAIEFAYRAMLSYEGIEVDRSRPETDVVAGMVLDYVEQLGLLGSYLTAQERLGGLIADFTIIDGRIYQERVTPLTVYLQHLIGGTGEFEDLRDKSFANKVKIGWDVLEKYICCMREVAKRGAIITNVKLTNFGIRDNGEVVLFDLGRSSLEWYDRNYMGLDFARSLLNTKIAMDARRLENLNAEGVVEETGVREDFTDRTEAGEIQKELARIWAELISARPVAADDSEALKRLDGRNFTRSIMSLFPTKDEDAKREHRRITFIPNDIAAEEILQIIMKHIVENRGRENANRPPKGSIRGLFSYLCDKGITGPDTALEGEEIADSMDLKFSTVEYDLRALYYHLRLIEKVDAKKTGRKAAYYVPERVRNKRELILPVLAAFTGSWLRPRASLLDEVHNNRIEPLLSGEDRARYSPRSRDGRPPVILLLGRAGSGKTTLGRSLAKELRVPHVSLGSLINRQRSLGHRLGREKLSDNGYVYGKLLAEELKMHYVDGGLVIDDSPRTADSVDALKKVLAEAGLGLEAIIELSVSAKTADSRVLHRSDKEARPWDKKKYVRAGRLRMHREFALPQIARWREKGQVLTLDAEAEPWLLEARALGKLKEKGVVAISERTLPARSQRRLIGQVRVAGEKIMIQSTMIGDDYSSIELTNDRGERIGFFYVMTGREDDTLFGSSRGIRGIYVKPEYRGMGLAKKMIESYFGVFGAVDLLLDEVMNPVLIHLAKNYLGFVAVDPLPENRVYLDLAHGEGEKPRIWIPDAYLRLCYDTGPAETMRGQFKSLREEPDDLDRFEQVYFNTFYKRASAVSESDKARLDWVENTPGISPASLQGVDAVITDFDGVDRDHSREVVTDDVIEAKREMSKRGVRSITITGLDRKRLFERIGGSGRAGRMSEASEYIVLNCSGATGHLVSKDGRIRPLEGFSKARLGDDATAGELERIAAEALLSACLEEGLAREAADDIEIWTRPEQVTISTRKDARVNALRNRIAGLIRKRLLHEGFPTAIEVSVSAGAVDITATSKGLSAIQMIKLLRLEKVVIVGDSVGTSAEPGNDRSLLTLTKRDLKEAGVDWPVEIIPVYVGSEENCSLPDNVLCAPSGGKEYHAALGLYRAISRAQDELVRDEIARERSMRIWGPIDRRKLTRWLEIWKRVQGVPDEVGLRRLSRTSADRTLSFSIGKDSGVITFDVVKDLESGRKRLLVIGEQLDEGLRRGRLMSLMHLYLVQLYDVDEVYHERMNPEYGEKFFRGLENSGIYSRINFEGEGDGVKYRSGTGEVNRFLVRHLVEDERALEKFLAKEDPGRGWEGLPNEIYTPEIKEAFRTGRFFAVRYREGRFEFAETALKGGISQMPEASGEELAILDQLYPRLIKPHQELLKHLDIVFFEGERVGHYSLSREQIYINARLLKKPRPLKRVICHEIDERAYVIKGMDKFDPDWREKRGRERIEERINELAREKHRKLKSSEGGYLLRAAEEFLDEKKHPVIRVSSFRELLKRVMGNREKIDGIDFGAGSGDKTRDVMQLLESLYPKVSFTGVDSSDIRAKVAISRGIPVVPLSVEEYMRSGLFKSGKDIVTMFSVYPPVLAEFIDAAKWAISKDGIIIIALGEQDMMDLIKGDKVYGAVDADQVWSILSDFELVRFSDTLDWPQGDSSMALNPYAFVYMPGRKISSVMGIDRVKISPPPEYSNLAEYGEWLEEEVLGEEPAGNIRPASDADREAVKDLSRRINPPGYSDGAASCISGKGPCLVKVYEEDGKVLGYIWFSHSDDKQKMQIEEIAVSQAAEGRGIASHLLADVISQGLRSGIRTYLTQIKITGDRSFSLFKKFGFRWAGGRQSRSNAIEYRLELAAEELLWKTEIADPRLEKEVYAAGLDLSRVMARMKKAFGGRAKSIEDVLNEILLNMTEYTRGGYIKLYAERDDKDDIKSVKILSKDRGEGLPDKPDDLLEKSLLRRESAGRGMGFPKIALEPDEAVIECSNTRWVRRAEPGGSGRWFMDEGRSDVRYGTRYTLVYDLAREQEYRTIGKKKIESGDVIVPDEFNEVSVNMRGKIPAASYWPVKHIQRACKGILRSLPEAEMVIIGEGGDRTVNTHVTSIEMLDILQSHTSSDGTCSVDVLVRGPYPASALLRAERELEKAADKAFPEQRRTGSEWTSPAGEFTEQIIAKAFEASRRGQKIIIGIDTSWIPLEQGIQPLVSEVCRLSRREGLENIIFVRERSSELAGRVVLEAEKSSTSLSNVIILAPEQAIRSEEFDPLRSTSSSKKAFLAGVDARELTGSSYVALLEMLTLAVKLAFGETVSSDRSVMGAERIGPRTWIFIPKAKPMDFEMQKAVYHAQLQALIAA
ncbi:MAG: GNAT family N-acetyltransferase, partial [Candidatus Omnitrophica bacterium]|nr:GNAT family N-acetyltransferase [Candidatus Omnitrophota bacterium]